MREIKFRAWNKKTKTMVDLYKITPFAIDQKMNMDGLFLPFIEELILMQFTGLHDKNGKEIYEGDILKPSRYWQDFLNEDFIYIFWHEILSQWLITTNIVEEIDVYTICSESKIIGNIYDNPELLEVE